MSEEYYPNYPRASDSEESMTRPMYNMAEESFLKARIEVNDLLIQLKHRLQGKIEDETGKWIPLGDPLMNDKGINGILSIVNFYCNINTLFAELTREDINMICYNLSPDLAGAIVAHESEWDVREMPLTKRAILDFIFITLTRAQGRGEAKSIGMLTQLSRQTITTQKEKGSRLPFFKGGRDKK